jgi:hypothetical protein
METRIIDLIKNPETLRVEDLNLLETEIEKFPYMQSLRAIYLLGVHRFYNEHFPKELAKTAAYTTDKRILYNLINKTNENRAAALAESPIPFKTEFTTKTPEIQEFKIKETPLHTEEEVVENTDLVVETQSVEISEPVSFVEENTNEEQQATNIETPSIPEVSPVEEPQYSATSLERSEYEQKKLAIDEYIAAEMAKLKSGTATEEPSIVEKEEDVEPVKVVETINETEKEEIAVEEVKAEEISPVETVEKEVVEIETELVVETEEERFSAEELASPSTFNLKKPKETTIDFYNKKQTGYVEEISTAKEDYYSSAKPVEEENKVKETTVDFYTKKQAESVEETPTPKEDFYSAKTTSESSAENEERETTIDFYARKQTESVEETSTQKEDFYSAKTTSESSTENEARETTIDFYARKQTESVEESRTQKENYYSSESLTENETRGTNIDFYASKKTASDTQEEQKSTHSPVDIYQKTIDTENTEKDEPAEVYKNPVDFYSSQNKPVQEEENVSATEDVADSEKPETEPVKVTEVVKPASNSNVTSFISTWKSWLKIDRSEIITPSEQDKKAAIIDKFIENNPKISPIKEDVDFIVKEKSNDISHLMTETLALLYVEQKLYTKAIQAYKILQEKHPERTDEFEERIEEIKKSRNIK